MPSELVEQWSARGVRLAVPATAATRIWSEGEGEVVVCLHGVPSSAWLYRKVLPELASRGLRGIALDFPGMGLADRPEDFDYTWTGLSEWLEQALYAAGIDRFHLVVHDVGGPVGFDLVRRIPECIQSLTVLNTLVYAASFAKPWVMRPFGMPVLGRLWVLQMDSPGIFPFFRWKGICAGPSYAEIRVYGELLTLGDGGRAFERIMSSFELNPEFEERILPGLQERSFPAQVVWGKYDTELAIGTFGEAAKRALRLKTEICALEGKHFLQENCAAEIADRVKQLVVAKHDI